MTTLQPVVWPEPNALGQYVGICSCGKWEVRGDITSVTAQANMHDDAPWQRHVTRCCIEVTDPIEVTP